MQILDDLSWLKNFSFMKKTRLSTFKDSTQLRMFWLNLIHYFGDSILSAVISKMNGLKFVANSMFNQ